MTDLPGKAIHDFHFTDRRKKLFVHDEFGPKVEMPVSYYFRNFKKMGSRTKPGGLGKKSGKSVEEEGPAFDAA